MFEPKARVIYDKNPLAEVSAQMTFEATLSELYEERPVSFHKAIRDEFPIYLHEGDGVHTFFSKDRLLKLELEPQSLTLFTSHYVRWESFFALWQKIEPVFRTHYPQAKQAKRVALDYLDVIQRRDLGLQGVSWHELLSPMLLGMVAAPEPAWTLLNAEHQLNFKCAEDVYISIWHGLHHEEQESSYVIRANYYTEKRQEEALAKESLERLRPHTQALFRACISDKLHLALEPKQP